MSKVAYGDIEFKNLIYDFANIQNPKGKNCWYKIYRRHCQVCGDVLESRERQRTPKPKNAEERVKETLGYCGCMDYELYGDL